MPWNIQENEGKFCVYKEGDTDPMHCYDSEAEARDYMAALYAHADDTKAIKAVGDWELEVLGVPFGGPNGGKDSQGEYFSPATNLYLEHYKSPLVTYYHGFTENGRPQGEPVVIGQATYKGKDERGHWWSVILDKASEYARRVMDAARHGMAFASSGSLVHLVRKASDGEITHWPIGELTLLDAGDRRRPVNKFAVALPVMKAHYDQAGLNLPEAAQPAEATQEGQSNKPIGGNEMEPQEISKLVSEQVAAAMKAQADAQAAEVARKAEIEAKAKELADAQIEAIKAEAAKGRRIYSGFPAVTKFHEISKYDNLPLEDQATLVEVMNAAKNAGKGPGASELALKAAAIKALEGKDDVSKHSLSALKANGFALKADEVMQQDLTTYGDEWVGVAYGTNLWESIRVNTFVLGKLPQEEVPQGAETMKSPLEGADPTWYKVAETTDTNATTLVPNATVPTSKVGTSNVSPTLAKAGARVLWSGELDEDSLIPMLPHLRAKMAVSGAEMIEQVLIDGDNATTATTNINDIAATGAQAGTEIYLLFDGFRVSPLVTTTANSRSAAGSFVSSDFLATLKLMGSAGINALDVSKVGFIIDPNTHWAALELPEVKTRDSFAMPTIERGKLTGIYGYDVFVSARMHASSTARLANSSGKVDQDTTANNAYGAILAVRWDQWRFGWKRRPKTTIEYVARSDSYEITSLLRIGLVQRDTEASAITYYVGI